MAVIIDDPQAAFPLEETVAVAGAAVGSDNAFAVKVNFVAVYTTNDLWIAKSAAGVAAAGDGSNNDHRIFVAAGERRVIPWGSRGFWCVNANGGETAVVRADGWV
jgi:hypothetical protein